MEPVAEPEHGGMPQRSGFNEKWLSLIALLLVTVSAAVLFYPK